MTLLLQSVFMEAYVGLPEVCREVAVIRRGRALDLDAILVGACSGEIHLLRDNPCSHLVTPRRWMRGRGGLRGRWWVRGRGGLKNR